MMSNCPGNSRRFRFFILPERRYRFQKEVMTRLQNDKGQSVYLAFCLGKRSNKL
jgi:hypothetical protein